jgi:hypothetical protein
MMKRLKFDRYTLYGWAVFGALSVLTHAPWWLAGLIALATSVAADHLRERLEKSAAQLAEQQEPEIPTIPEGLTLERSLRRPLRKFDDGWLQQITASAGTKPNRPPGADR